MNNKPNKPSSWPSPKAIFAAVSLIGVGLVAGTLLGGLIVAGLRIMQPDIQAAQQPPARPEYTPPTAVPPTSAPISSIALKQWETIDLTVSPESETRFYFQQETGPQSCQAVVSLFDDMAEALIFSKTVQFDAESELIGAEISFGFTEYEEARLGENQILYTNDLGVTEYTRENTANFDQVAAYLTDGQGDWLHFNAQYYKIGPTGNEDPAGGGGPGMGEVSLFERQADLIGNQLTSIKRHVEQLSFTEDGFDATVTWEFWGLAKVSPDWLDIIITLPDETTPYLGLDLAVDSRGLEEQSLQSVLRFDWLSPCTNSWDIPLNIDVVPFIP